VEWEWPHSKTLVGPKNMTSGGMGGAPTKTQIGPKIDGANFIFRTIIWEGENISSTSHLIWGRSPTPILNVGRTYFPTGSPSLQWSRRVEYNTIFGFPLPPLLPPPHFYTESILKYVVIILKQMRQNISGGLGQTPTSPPPICKIYQIKLYIRRIISKLICWGTLYPFPPS
jgi:hypothetical protein